MVSTNNGSIKIYSPTMVVPPYFHSTGLVSPETIPIQPFGLCIMTMDRSFVQNLFISLHFFIQRQNIQKGHKGIKDVRNINRHEEKQCRDQINSGPAKNWKSYIFHYSVFIIPGIEIVFYIVVIKHSQHKSCCGKHKPPKHNDKGRPGIFPHYLCRKRKQADKKTTK